MSHSHNHQFPTPLDGGPTPSAGRGASGHGKRGHCHGEGCQGHHHHSTPQGDVHTVKDPVCGMTVDPATAKHRAQHDGKTYYFCSEGCLTKFKTDPKRYLAPVDRDAAAKGAIYTCPMHPEIRQVGPGTCPICGMALEPEVASVADEPNPELLDMSRRFKIGLVFALPVVALEMGGHFLGLDRFVGPRL